MKKILLTIFLCTSFLAVSQNPISVQYHGVSTVQVDPNTEKIIDEWETVNSCVYSVDENWKIISYVERAPNGDVVKSWEYPIESSFEDETVYNFYANETVIAIWKNGSMVSLQDKETVYLIGGTSSGEIK